MARWHTAGRLADIDITLIVDRPNLLGVREIDNRLRHRLDEIGVRLPDNSTVTALHPAEQHVSVTTSGGADQRVAYDVLHLVPPFRGPRWIESSGLAGDAHGLVDIDAQTFRHRVHLNVRALGDAANVATGPSGGAIRRQSAILVNNLMAARNGGRFNHYDGYTVAPIATDAHH